MQGPIETKPAELEAQTTPAAHVETAKVAPISTSSLSLKSLGRKDLAKLCSNAFVLYSCFLMAGSMIYIQLGGSFTDTSLYSQFGYMSCAAEAFGLLMLRHKIQRQESVSGISGMTLGMYAIVYALRAVMEIPPLTLLALDDWSIKVLEVAAFFLVLDVLYAVFKTYKTTYQKELDVLKIQYLVPGCLLLAVVLHPDLRIDLAHSLGWTATLYLDVMALMPQVVMMSKGGVLVEAPISHFVAATALSRAVDLWFWYYAFDTVGPIQNQDALLNYSGWLIVFFHVVHLALVADFIYYYIRARCYGRGFSEDVSIEEV